MLPSFNRASIAVRHRFHDASTRVPVTQGIEMNQFTAARADQHRADLMSAARDARDYRRAKNAATRDFRLRAWRAPLSAALPVTRLVRVPDAV